MPLKSRPPADPERNSGDTIVNDGTINVTAAELTIGSPTGFFGATFNFTNQGTINVSNDVTLILSATPWGNGPWDDR